ncbi:Calpain-5 [Oopsacas minuta]|uniref:Calpain-5 n=1 Tax=Oopsacas minuta TaxID=111878 RepID=A0AAV7KSF9_9METZ|nr:Calpain-5 [Oopsacas minuta]
MTFTRFGGQDYNALKKQTRQTNTLFEDPTFGAVESSLYPCASNEKRDVVWKRPGEITDNPRLFVDGTDSDDVIQGCLGNCWFAAALATLAKNKKLLDLVIPNIKHQEWVHSTEATVDGESKIQVTPRYGGIFKFRFWRMGGWIEVIVDDRLPVVDGKLIYIHSREENEFWSALVEKAYAKLNSCYESLRTGSPGEALVDFTGGINETIKLPDSISPKELDIIFQKLIDVQKNHALIVASIHDPDGEQKTLPQGLVTGHTYSLTNIHDMRLNRGLFAIFKRERMAMIRLRNPWGELEWTGPWSDGSEEWTKIPETEKNDMGLVFTDDGEFWMEMTDFVQFFSSIDICEVFNTNIFNFSKTWVEFSTAGQWNQRSAGGGMAHDSFVTNPQYLISIKHNKGREGNVDFVCHLTQQPWLTKEPDDIASPARAPGESVEASEGTQLIVQGPAQKISHYPIGITLIRAEHNREYRMHKKREPIETTVYFNSRDTFTKVTLHEGKYIMIPNTSEPGQTGDYFLRSFSDRKIVITELVRHHPIGIWYKCISQPQFTVLVDLEKAEGLLKQDQIGGADPYCILTLGKQKSRSHFINDTVDPQWNSQFIFYTANRGDNLRIRVWNKNVLKDDFMGQIIIALPGPQDADGRRYCRELVMKDGSHPQNMGTLSFVVRVYNDVREL